MVFVFFTWIEQLGVLILRHLIGIVIIVCLLFFFHIVQVAGPVNSIQSLKCFRTEDFSSDDCYDDATTKRSRTPCDRVDYGDD